MPEKITARLAAGETHAQIANSLKVARWCGIAWYEVDPIRQARRVLSVHDQTTS
jgi:hypothetical protein